MMNLIGLFAKLWKTLASSMSMAKGLGSACGKRINVENTNRVGYKNSILIDRTAVFPT